ncbi:hypothetical protein JTE90_020892 [Oedothorax gibbosus]|uniref:C2H2-type domain-containing protein n=1 Tax=Oedothorax gibbosus TaxID=931172 RepID=A0AAV6U9J1_9ARAC|nr:hypothetical protein JTE90_020892 [Oedothorax gibbosus]
MNITKKQCNGLRVHGPNTELVGTASVNVIPTKDGTPVKVKIEPLEPLEDQNLLKDVDRFTYWNRRSLGGIDMANSKLKLNINLKEKKNRDFNILNTKGLPWSFPNTTSENSDGNSQEQQTENAVSTSSKHSGETVQESNATERDARNTDALPLNNSGYISDFHSEDDECEIIHEICIAVTGVHTHIEQRHYLLEGNTHVECNEGTFPLTDIIFGDQSAVTNIQEDLPECDKSETSGEKYQETKTIQYTIDKLPTPSSILDAGSDSNFLSITSHTVKPPRNVRCFQQESIEIDKCNEEYIATDAKSGSRRKFTDTRRNLRSMLPDSQLTSNRDRTPSCLKNFSRSKSNSKRQQLNDQQAHQTTLDPVNVVPSNIDSDTEDIEQLLDDQPIRPFNQATSIYYMCDKCNADPFPTHQDLRRHKMTHGLCPLCPEEHFTTEAMVNHLQDCHGMFCCADCDAIFGDEGSLARHKISDHRHSRCYPKQFACTKCFRVYKTKGRFLLHLRTHTMVRNTCLECQKDFDETLTYHKRSSYFFGVMCAKCRSKTLHSSSLQQIKQKMRTIKFRYLCLICKIEFPSIDELEGHMGVHSQQARDTLRALQNRQ